MSENSQARVFKVLRHSGVTAAPRLFINGIRYSVGVARRRHRWKIEQLMAAIITANH